ncbi:hypothetical protein CRUP_022873 [Coryphaenoides rupestris]|nr:hypothetical protein CRUP_022873 [Coryphaenoides rupestris]
MDTDVRTNLTHLSPLSERGGVPPWALLGYFGRNREGGSGGNGALIPQEDTADLPEIERRFPQQDKHISATCVYFVLWLPPSSPSWFSALIKCLPIFCLWVFLLAHGFSFLRDHSNARKILAGLIFSSLGDAFLIWQEQGYFSHGLLMFAITHILYSSAFGMRPMRPAAGLVIWRASRRSPTRCSTPTWRGPSPTWWPSTSPDRLHGLARHRRRAAGGRPVDVDAAVGVPGRRALHGFCFPVPHSRAIIMATYYAAQMLIALSAVECQDAAAKEARKRA